MLKLPIMKIKNTFKQINIIATQYVHSRLVHKQGLETDNMSETSKTYHKIINKKIKLKKLQPSIPYPL